MAASLAVILLGRFRVALKSTLAHSGSHWLPLAPSGSLRLSLSSNLLTKSLLGSQAPFYRSGCCCISFPSRSKMDPNRLEEEAAQGNQGAVEAYRQVAILKIPHVNSCSLCDVDNIVCVLVLDTFCGYIVN